jgi:hypothetical protein
MEPEPCHCRFTTRNGRPNVDCEDCEGGGFLPPTGQQKSVSRDLSPEEEAELERKISAQLAALDNRKDLRDDEGGERH